MRSKKKRFIDSKEWRNLREQALERDKFECFLCGHTESLCVHHIRYRRFDKNLEDKLYNLVTLCKSCHWLVHKSSKNIELTLKLQKERPNQLKKLI